MSDTSETLPMDFVGAAQSEGEPAMFYLSSDEDEYGDRIGPSSIWDVSSSTEDGTEEVAAMARFIERQVAKPIPTPSSDATSSQNSEAKFATIPDVRPKAVVADQ